MKINNNTCDDIPSFDDLQPFFDEQSRRLDAILDHPEAQPKSLNRSHANTARIRLLRAWGIFASICLAISVYWGIALWSHNFDIYYRVFTLVLEAIFISLTIDSASTAISLLRHNPADVSFDRMQHTARHSTTAPHLLSDFPKTHSPSKPTNVFLFSNFKRTIPIGAAASLMLVLVSCATKVGDGNTITQNHNARIEVVDDVIYTLSIIS